MARKKTKPVTLTERTLDARPDTLDFRDRMFVPTLTEVPTYRPLEDYQQKNVPVLDQGVEGACTGFGLATVVNCLLMTRRVVPDATPVSARMLYEMAKRYDEWPGEGYSGSSARGAMKGWHKHGVCTDVLWPYKAGRVDDNLTPARADDSKHRPLGAYFRVNHRDLVAMHCAIQEAEILYATAIVHEGWNKIGSDGTIPHKTKILGGHAFAIVAYDSEGFWIQNSWSTSWGRGGFAKITYADWLENGTDVWVARLGVPIELQTAGAIARANAEVATSSVGYTFHDIRPHIISIGNDGRLRETGTYGTSEDAVKNIFEQDIPRVTAGWKKKRILLYAHGGLTDEKSAIQRVADYRQVLLDAEIYPLAFIWKTDYWTTLVNILKDALKQRRTEGLLDTAKDFMLDRLDDALEPLARFLTGKAQWDEMKENALAASTSAQGGVRKMARHLQKLIKDDNSIELHIAGHSAGSIFMAPLIQLLCTKGKIKSGPMKNKTGLGQSVSTCTMWAPACTVELFKETYQPAVEGGNLSKFALFTLTDKAERDDHCAKIYHKSLLYLVSNAFEDEARVPLFRDGEPILGMQKFIEQDPDLQKFFKRKSADWVRSPNTNDADPKSFSTSLSHGGFDDDEATLAATFARILQTNFQQMAKTEMPMHASQNALRATRMGIEATEWEV
ncbi:Papain family cysteine protease [Gimesia alba]|uniref:Papain family cysteine protease n=1 Tax=Gimesia alba TaxID=2527973 RepID=A0A517RA54_9PLAN|nr:C1 family peptidase [Gimesia alba]QDT40766.1 Papain family cysteine protease [Gimesia alba]